MVGIIRKRPPLCPPGHWTLFAGDILVLEGDAQALEQITTTASLSWSAKEGGSAVAARRDRHGRGGGDGRDRR